MRSFSVFTALALITTLSQAAPAPVPVPVAVADPRRLTREEDLPHHRPDLIRLAHLQPDTNAAPDDGGNTDKPKTNFYRFANDGLDLSSSRNGGEEEEEEKPLAVGVPVLIAEGSNAKTLRNELDRERRSRVVIAGNEQEGERGEGGMVLAKNGDGAAEQGRRKLKTAGTSSSSNSRLSSKAECIAVPWYCHSACLSYIEPQFNPTMVRILFSSLPFSSSFTISTSFHYLSSQTQSTKRLTKWNLICIYIVSR